MGTIGKPTGVDLPSRKVAEPLWPAVAGPARADVLEHAYRLQNLGRKIEEFLNEQLRRLERMLETCRQTDAVATANRASADLERRRAAWELQRDEELKRIEEERTQLIQAWSRIEAEQRRILAQPDSMQRGLAVNSQEREATTERSVATAHTAQVRAPRETQNEKANDQDGLATNVLAGESVIAQFQQIRCDVRKHAQRRNRKG